MTVAIGAAGCLDTFSNERTSTPADDGSAPREANPLSVDGTPIDELTPMTGELTIYSGRREAQIGPILSRIEDRYDDFSLEVRYGDSAGLVGQIVEEGTNSPADLFYTQDSGTLGALKSRGRTAPLAEDILDVVPASWRDPDGTWTGVSGRVRSVAYNTDVWSAGDLPTDIFEYAKDERFRGQLGWRTNSGSFLSFVRAMMIVHGEERTRGWITGLQELGIRSFEGGSSTPLAIANGDVTAGFVNQYYVARLLSDRPDAPIDVTFTDGDVGSLFNVSGVAVVDTSDEHDLATNLIRHLLTLEGQEYFVDVNKEYAVIPHVEYVGDLPPLDEIEYPEFDLNDLSDLQPALDLLRETGVL